MDQATSASFKFYNNDGTNAPSHDFKPPNRAFVLLGLPVRLAGTETWVIRYLNAAVFRLDCMKVTQTKIVL